MLSRWAPSRWMTTGVEAGRELSESCSTDDRTRLSGVHPRLLGLTLRHLKGKFISLALPRRPAGWGSWICWSRIGSESLESRTAKS